MKIKYLNPSIIAIAVAALLSACSSMPTSTSLLDQTRSDYMNAQNNPKVATYAPLEMKNASEAFELANKAANERESAEKIDKLAYIAKQKIGVAQETAKQKSAEMDVVNAAKERDKVRLDQRTNEANAANANAEQAKLAEQAAQAEALLAKQKAQEALDQANAAQMAQQETQLHNAQLQAQLDELSAKQTERGLVITLGDVLFATNSADLNNNGLRTVEKLAVVLKENPKRVVIVEGFTDSVGTESYNLALSERRGNSVRSALMSQGIEANRVVVRGYGESFPVAGNATAQDRQMNRRVEIVLSDAEGKVKPRQ